MQKLKTFLRENWLALLIFALALFARTLPGPRIIDDSYITYRYARNILAGDGFAYNPGQPVLGTTTPLYTLLLVAMGAVFPRTAVPFPELALALNALLDAFTAILLLAIGRKLGSEFVGVGAGLAWAVAPFSVTFAIGGLETSLYVFLLVLVWLSYLNHRYTITAAAAALSLLTRPDALILILPLAFDRLFFDQKRAGKPVRIKELLLFFIPVLLWLAYSAIHFGSLLPQSIAAKSQAYRLPELSALTRLLQHYATPFMGHHAFGNIWIRVGLILYPFLFLVGARQAFRADKSLWSFIVFPWLYFLTFAVPNPLIFRWYLTPPLPFYFVFILLGLEDILRNTLNQVRENYARGLRFAFVSLAPFILLLQAWQLRPDHGPQRPAPQMAWYELELLYRQVADELAPQIAVKENATLAAGDVGVLGYYTGARILDLVGLNSPQTLAYYPLDDSLYSEYSYAVSPELILDYLPDYVVILEIYGRGGLLEHPQFEASYHQIIKLPTDIYGSGGMLVFALQQAD